MLFPDSSNRTTKTGYKDIVTIKSSNERTLSILKFLLDIPPARLSVMR